MIIKMTNCCHCGAEIGVGVPNRYVEVDGCSCNDCVPEDSPARNGIEESLYTEHPITYRLRKNRERVKRFESQRS